MFELLHKKAVTVILKNSFNKMNKSKLLLVMTFNDHILCVTFMNFTSNLLKFDRKQTAQ